MRPLAIALVLVAAWSAPAAAAECLDELDARGVSYRKVSKKGVAIGVEVTGPLGGVTWRSSSGKELILDCSLAISIDEEIGRAQV